MVTPGQMVDVHADYCACACVGGGLRSVQTVCPELFGPTFYPPIFLKTEVSLVEMQGGTPWILGWCETFPPISRTPPWRSEGRVGHTWCVWTWKLDDLSI